MIMKPYSHLLVLQKSFFAALIFLLTSTVAWSQTYDAARDFSPSENPTGPWSYGFKKTPLGAMDDFQLYDVPSNRGGELDFWFSSALGEDPSVGHNPFAEPKFACPLCDFTAYPGQLFFHPGKQGELSIVRWTAPRGGLYDVNVSATGLGASSTIGLYIFAYTQDKVILDPLEGRGQSTEFSDHLYVKPGASIDVGVDFGSNHFFGSDATGLTFTLDPIHAARRATAIARVINGFVVEILVTDGGEGFTETPHVEIVGPGSGAVAKATIEDGQVTSITIVSAGSGYDASTRVNIAPPSKLPTLSIRVQTVRLTFSVWRGNHYRVQASPDLKSWTTVSDFIADADTVTKDFEVTETGRFFTISEVSP
jgi:hypothetical protein